MKIYTSNSILTNPDLIGLLACPICKHRINTSNKSCQCTNNDCRATFPVLDGRPILLNEKNSLFRIKEVSESYTKRPSISLIQKFIQMCVPSITRNRGAARNYARLVELLSKRNHLIAVLIVGGGELGEGIENLLNAKNIKMIESDVYFSSRTHLVADGHDLPFLDQSFDAVVIQGVLQHVVDPYRCVAEIYRVLRSDGIVYAESPFMYPVHMGAYDFVRFSMGAHRRLFRNFTEIDSGIVGGPGQALALSIRSFILSFSTSSTVKFFATAILPFFIFWLKYCDCLLSSKPHVEDFASTIFFLGEKAQIPISDEKIIEAHWSKRGSSSGRQ